VFSAAIDANLVLLALFGIAASVIGAFYYIKIIKIMYFDAAAPAFAPPPSKIENGLIAASAVVIALGYPLIPWLDALTNNAAKALF
jgi:NADH-quinone oxidoreductase subunit N